ncbi:MAG: hypothetical protein MUD12_05605 [Spirochaetes bacterium]|nr:hypothetical protein [Spirochaetota bacterium]
MNICRPGRGASCALCCGSHNYRADTEELDRMYAARSSLFKNFSREYLVRCIQSGRNSMTGSYLSNRTEAIYEFQLIRPEGTACQYLGYAEDKRLGCLLSRDPGLKQDCFFNYYGKDFSCRAGRELTVNEVLFAAELFGDWYYYSLSIYETSILKILHKKFNRPEMLDCDAIDGIKRKLASLVISDPVIHSIHAYFE